MLKISAIISTFLVASTIAVSAFAVDFQQARSQGLVGEKPDGYVAVVSGGGDVQSIVNDVNQKRKAAYQDISQKNHQPLDVVGKLAAEKIITNLAPGEYYQNGSGKWVKK
ncbi:MAG: YdbL family protein [Alphaproteobacteria bacterium]|nr:YdbL family protein [Alphaproteobacteria bacterium]